MKIISWNVDGFKSIIKKGLENMLNQEINMSYLQEVKSIEKSEIENYFFL